MAGTTKRNTKTKTKGGAANHQIRARFRKDLGHSQAVQLGNSCHIPQLLHRSLSRHGHDLLVPQRHEVGEVSRSDGERRGDRESVGVLNAAEGAESGLDDGSGEGGGEGEEGVGEGETGAEEEERDPGGDGEGQGLGEQVGSVADEGSDVYSVGHSDGGASGGEGGKHEGNDVAPDRVPDENDVHPPALVAGFQHLLDVRELVLRLPRQGLHHAPLFLLFTASRSSRSSRSSGNDGGSQPVPGVAGGVEVVRGKVLLQPGYGVDVEEGNAGISGHEQDVVGRRVRRRREGREVESLGRPGEERGGAGEGAVGREVDAERGVRGRAGRGG